jgi:iron complex outermembrane recepter protein
MKRIFNLLSLLVTVPAFGQGIDTNQIVHLQTVTTYTKATQQETSVNISTLKIDSLSKYGNYNLTDLLAKIPGVSMLTTGVAIAKPVIRGLYGNRVLVLLSGLKFDNQQWQEEHGLGITDMGISKVELIKGPMSVLYGTEAMGGIINVVQEEKPAANTKESDVSIKMNSNTLGGMLQAGYKVNYGNRWFGIRAAVENNADYSDGNNNRVLNSRFDGYALKASYGFEKGNWTSTNNFSSSYNRFGFIFNDIYTFIKPDDRWSRKLDVNPAHLVMLNILSSENKFELKNNSKLTLNVGIQSNRRLENEGGGAISLNMHLLTTQYLLKWEKDLSIKNKLIIANLGSFENNSNYGSRKIVPDANMQESNISVYLETNIRHKWIFENGVGAGEKWIKTLLTPTVNTPDKDIHPFSKCSTYYNLFSGFTFLPKQSFNLKFNIATGVRIPNLAELSSNGLHEGVFTYEIGSPLLKNEQNISGNLLLNITRQYFEISITPFYNFFYNYVYLAPTNETWSGFPVYRYKQQNARQYGTEFSFIAKPTKRMQAGIAYSGMISKTADGNYTPYIPAQKITPNINYTLDAMGTHKIMLYSNADFCFAQDNTAPYEIATPFYWLLNAGATTSFNAKSTTYAISLAGNNLLNVAYYDHLSRFKNYGLLNMGRNIVITLKVKFDRQLNRK